uniref:Lectin/glucanase superfamily protein n=1 Tax=viral metagenome TaxID=1070528 RepID=A0A6C0IJG8_9ZZZZ
MSSSFGKVSEGAGGFIRPFSSNRYIQGSSEFLQSNSLVAKFAFLILALILFVMALRLGSAILAWLFSPSQSPILIDGMIVSNQMMRIPQDPKVPGSVPILRSNNSTYGLEFTWSVWIFVNDFAYKENEYKHVFHKGNDGINVSTEPIGMNYPNNGPGLYIAPHTNNLVVVMSTFDEPKEEVIVKDLPLNKWVNVIMRVSKQNQLDVYVNGVLAKRHMLKSVPKQNYGDVFVSMNGGFSGFTSDLRYFSSALGTSHIQSIVDKGPNEKMLDGSDMSKSKPQYLSARWYFNRSED